MSLQIREFVRDADVASPRTPLDPEGQEPVPGPRTPPLPEATHGLAHGAPPGAWSVLRTFLLPVDRVVYDWLFIKENPT